MVSLNKILYGIPIYKVAKSRAAGVERRRESWRPIMPPVLCPPLHPGTIPHFFNNCDGSTKGFYFINDTDEKSEARRSCDLREVNG